jgi:hypothetical protein
MPGNSLFTLLCQIEPGIAARADLAASESPFSWLRVIGKINVDLPRHAPDSANSKRSNAINLPVKHTDIGLPRIRNFGR